MTDEHPVSYLALQPGTPVESSTGRPFGTVEHVLQVPEEDLFDGVVVATDRGLRFVDRDQILEITNRAVRCSLGDADVANLPEPGGPPVYHVDALQDVGPSLTARLGRMFGASAGPRTSSGRLAVSIGAARGPAGGEGAQRDSEAIACSESV